MSHGRPPIIPAEFQQYNSYVEDPKWQRRFTTIWGAFLATAVVCSLPYLVKSVRNGRMALWFRGVGEDMRTYTAVPSDVKASNTVPTRRSSGLRSILQTAGNVFLWSPPGLELNMGQIFAILVYLVIVLVCIIVDAPLRINSNRAGFIALAQFPVVFLFATKNSVLSLLLGPGHGYEKLNYIHRWASRCMFLGAAVHGGLWINNHLRIGLPLLGQEKETTGIAAFGVLCVIVLTSVRWARNWSYETFFVVHILGFVSFFITVCYHTTYASPWIFPPLAFYGLDILMRMFRVRIKDATLHAPDQQMTIIGVRDCDNGWEAGQHVRLRVFIGGRVFESHPLSILSAPRDRTCLSVPGLTLGARVRGDWTKAINEYARTTDEKDIQVMLDGPYGGSSVDLGEHESVLLFAGGSGATFTIGLLDDIVGRCVKQGRPNAERTRRISFVWCVRSFGTIEWFAPMLTEIAAIADSSSTIDLHIAIHVTCLCNPDAVPPIANSDVVVGRPTIRQALDDLVTPPVGEKETGAHVDPEGLADSTSKLTWVGLGGGVGVVACGPEGLTREASNAVARLSMRRGRQLGGVALHTEMFS